MSTGGRKKDSGSEEKVRGEGVVSGEEETGEEGGEETSLSQSEARMREDMEEWVGE